MNLNYENTTFTAVKDIKIPDLFYNRLKSGIETIDDLFGDGVLPGSAITMTAPAGCGKTTFLLQMLEGLSNQGFNTAYASGEENSYQLAYTCNRISVRSVKVANETDIDTLSELMADFDIMVIDSFQALTSKEKMNTRELERYAVSKLTRAAKDNECTVIFVMHLTKDGKLKGSTIVPHTVDVNMEIAIEGEFEDGLRKIFFSKNRFGALNEVILSLGGTGYDFGKAVVIEEADKVPAKKNNKEAELETILNMKEPPHLNANRVMKKLDCDYNHAYNRLRDLVMNDKLMKFGKGKEATYKHIEPTLVEV